MTWYIAVVHKDPESAFGVSFPDLPSVFSAADDEDDIVPNAIEALTLWAEDETLPQPSSHADILARDDVRAELREGAFLVASRWCGTTPAPSAPISPWRRERSPHRRRRKTAWADALGLSRKRGAEGNREIRLKGTLRCKSPASRLMTIRPSPLRSD